MLVGIYNIKGPNSKDMAVQQAYEKILDYNGIKSIRLQVEQEDFWEKVRGLSLFIMRFQHYDSSLQLARDILPVVENDFGIPCYPNQATAWHYDDKAKQAFLLKAHGFPITQTWVFYDKEAALNWAKHAEYPVVFKLKGGAGSMNIILAKTTKRATALIRRMFGRGIYPEKFVISGSVRFKHFNLYKEIHHLGGNTSRLIRGLDTSPFWNRHKNYVLFQKFLPDNDFDTRITVIGERAFAFRRISRKDDFRASGSGKIDYDINKIDPRCIEISFEVSRKMGFQSMAYDFLKNEVGEPEFCEISYTYVSSAVHDCPGYWDPELNWHEGQYWPEYLHLMDALGLSELKAPEMDY